MTPDRSRIDALEMRLAEQERTIDDLNATVTAQWSALDTLRRQVERALDQLAEAESRLPQDAEKPPPHY